jgi:hypothetical protein
MIPINEVVHETRNCSFCKSVFTIYQTDIEMLASLSPSFSWKKYHYPLPTECPNCRRIKRLMWRNEHKLYRRKCDASGQTILAFYPPAVKHPVYEKNIWMSDVWNALDYGKEFDFTRPFFEQFWELKDTVPQFARSILKDENSEYSNNGAGLKNCYLCFNGGEAEDCLYTIMFRNVKDCIDCYCIEDCANCYESVDLYKCQGLFYSQDCKDCFQGYFLKNCTNCKNCFLSKNLVNKEYYFMNQAYSKEVYEEKIREMLRPHTYEEIDQIFREFSSTLPEKHMHGVLNEHTSHVDYVSNSKDVFHSYDIRDSENIRYCARITDHSKNLMDIEQFWWELENSYNSTVVGHTSSRINFCFDCWEGNDALFYCIACIYNTKNCFWCIGLKGQQYCILNKQYTKEAYEILVPKIIEHMIKMGEWGQFFPPSLSSYGYNQTIAQMHFPLTKKEALTQWFHWYDETDTIPKVEKIISGDKLPVEVSEIPDDILNWAIECRISKRPFRITQQELQFYRIHSLPIPRLHPDERHKKRFWKRNTFSKLHNRLCNQCWGNIISTYNPDTVSNILCETCFNVSLI